jgi:hypothetical protein
VGYDCAQFGHLTVAGEDRCRACGAEAWLGCQVCEREDKDHAAVAVAASPLGPVSLAYCRECLAHQADALFMYEAVLEMDNWRAGLEGFGAMVIWKDGRYMTVAQALDTDTR